MKNVFLTMLFTAILFNSCISHSKNELIIGKWEKLEKVKDDGLDLQISLSKSASKSTKLETLLLFKNDGFAQVNVGQEGKDEKHIYGAKFKLENNELVIGNQKYKIIKLDSDSLILETNNRWMSEIHKYFKTSKQVIEVKQKETLFTKYSKGNIKTKEEYQLGFLHGTCEEYYENGKLKSEREFKNGIPTGVFKEYDELGEPIQKNN